MIDYKKRPGNEIYNIGKLKKEENITISIITPFYNGGKTLEETYRTVVSQTYPFFEWIIVDDGSKDEESLKILDKVQKMDKRIKVFYKENEGPSVARDFGINKSDANSKYIFFVDCDDLMENTMLEVLYWTLETHPDASFAYTTMVNFGDAEYTWEKYLTVRQQKEENLICISSMIKKEDLISVGCFGIKEKSMYEDWNLWLKLLAAGKKPIRVNAPIFWYRINNTGEFSRAKQNHERAMEFINNSAAKIKRDVEIIQFPRAGQIAPLIKERNLILPKYKSDNKKNILFIFPWTILGGADLFNLELIKRLDKDKYNIILITTLPSNNELRHDFSNEINEYYDLTTFLDREDYINFVDYIIDSRNIYTLFIGNSKIAYYMLPYLKNKYENLSVIDYIHSIDFNDPKGAFGRCTQDMDKYIDKTYCCNKFTKNQLQTLFNKKDVEVIYIGTDEKRFNPTKFNKEEIKDKYNIPKNKYIISFIARLAEEKRPQMFIQIAKYLLNKRDDLHFIIVGDGYLYKEISKEKTKNISVLGSLMNTEEIYAISDVTVNTSRLEGLALTSFESLSMNVPVLTSDVGGQTELIDDNVGRVVHYKENQTKEEQLKEVQEYCKKLEEILSNLDELKSNCRNKIINEKYTLDNMTKKIENIFDTIKSKKIINIDNAKLIYELSLENLYLEHFYNTKNYLENKFGIELTMDNKIVEKTKKQYIKEKIYNFFSSYNSVKEAKRILNLMHITYHLTFGLLKNIIYFIKYLILGIYSFIMITLKIIKKKFIINKIKNILS